MQRPRALTVPAGPTIPPEKKKALLQALEASVKDTMESLRGGLQENHTWEVRFRKKNKAFFMDKNTEPDYYRYCCVTHSSIPVASFVSALMADNRSELQEVSRVLHKDLLEAAIVGHLLSPDEDHPHRSAYVCYQSFQGSEERERLLAVATDVLHYDDGSTTGYCLWDSIDLDDWSMPGFRREEMFQSGFYFRSYANQPANFSFAETCDDQSEVDGSNVSSNDSDSSMQRKGRTKVMYLVGVPSLKPPTAKAIEQCGVQVDNLCSFSRRQAIDLTRFVPKNKYKRKSTAKRCFRCVRNFWPLTRRVNCQCCGEVVCRDCFLKEPVNLFSVGQQMLNICYFCLETLTFEESRSLRNVMTRDYYSDDGNESTSSGNLLKSARSLPV